MLHATPPLRAGSIARLAGEASRGVSVAALSTLVRMGIARRRTVLDHDAFEPDASSPYYRAAYLAAIVDIPVDAAISGEPIAAVIVFGSTARGTARRDSDIDMLVIGRVSDERAVRRRLSEACARYDRRIDAVVMTAEEVEAGMESGDQIVAGAERDGVCIRGAWRWR
jgi:predicted nucleotidyltransferase